MNRIIESNWSELPFRGGVRLFEAYLRGKPQWWKMTDEKSDMAFVEFSFELNITPQQALQLHAATICEEQFDLLWIASLWVPNERRGNGFGFILLNNLQEHFTTTKRSVYCGLNVSPFEDGTDFNRLKTGYLKQGFIQDPQRDDILIKK